MPTQSQLPRPLKIEVILHKLKVVWVNFAILLTLLIAIECFASLYYFVRRNSTPSYRVDPFVLNQIGKMPVDGYPEMTEPAWFEPYWQEFHDSTYSSVDWTSYSYWRRRPFAGKYINVDHNGMRATWNARPASAVKPVRIAQFGGSTMWGTGARDKFTIPSYVSKMLADAYPGEIEVLNYGQDGYVSTQEYITLCREIQGGNVPDIVVFYDGFNDSFAAFQGRVAGIPMNEENRRREFNILHPSRARAFYGEVLSRTSTFQLIQGLREKIENAKQRELSATVNDDALALDVVRVYFNTIKLITAASREFGFVPRFYWQPSVYTKNHRTKEEEAFFSGIAQMASFSGKVQNALTTVRHQSAPPNFRDISGVLDDYPSTAFIDNAHVTELANERIAREIVVDLKNVISDFRQKAGAQQHSIPQSGLLLQSPN